MSTYHTRPIGVEPWGTLLVARLKRATHGTNPACSVLRRVPMRINTQEEARNAHG
jgi:hypothetical protein